MAATRRSTALSTVITVMAMLAMTGCQDQTPTDPTVTGIALKPGGGGGKGPKVESTDPTSAPQETTLDVQVFGSSFDDGSSVTFTIDGTPSDLVHTNLTTFVNPKKLIANITIDLNAIEDLYDVEVLSSRGRKGIGADLFSVTKKGKPGVETYTINDLGTLPGNTSSTGGGINVNRDGEIQVVGTSSGGDAGLEVATRWTVTVDADGMTVTGVDSLEMPEGTKYASARAITETGIAVGGSGVGPVSWDADGKVQLLPVVAASGGKSANDVSLLGPDPEPHVLIVGQQRTIPVQAVYWVDGLLQPSLPALKPTANASAKAVNSAGTIAGWSSPGHPVVWHRDAQDKPYQVCDLGGGADNSGVAFGISEPTEQFVYVVGASDAADWFATVWTVDLDATLWEQPDKLCAVTNVRSLDFFSEFRDVNAQGDAVGQDIRKNRAILWPGGEGNALVYLPLLANKGLGFSGADAITADGKHIAGRSRIKKGMRAVLWTRKD